MTVRERNAVPQESFGHGRDPFEDKTIGMMHSNNRWANVPGLRAELEALHASWLSAHDRGLKPKVGSGAVNWHGSLARVLERLDWWRTRAKRNA